MEASDLAGILVVRSVEESAPELLSAEAGVDAAREAGPLDDEDRWLARRAERLLLELPPVYRSLPAMSEALAGRAGLAAGIAAVAGVLTNYLGPSQRIHAVYNPVVLLILWNLVVYALLLVGALRRGSGRSRPRDPGAGTCVEAAPARREGDGGGARPGVLTRWILRRTVPAFWSRVHRESGEAREQSRRLRSVGQRFFSLWIEVAQPLFALRVRRLLNWAALGLAAGAVLGMFVRGLFLDYHIVWRSTFVTEPRTVAAILEVLFAAPARLVGQPLPDAAAAAGLLGPDGVPAAGWIWLYASASALFIGVPRLALAAAHALRMRSLSARLHLALADPYYVEKLREARERRVGEIAAAIESDVRVETRRFASGIATWVCERLYDAEIVPRLERFRAQGGRLSELEAGIAQDCERFQEEFLRSFPRARSEFEASLSAAIARTIRAEVSFESLAPSGLADQVGGGSSEAAVAVARSVGTGIERTVGSALSGAIALAAGTVSGGFGKSLGLALVATLVGTSGPVGFLIGALGGLLAAGAAWLLGRERAAGALRSVALPASVARSLLWPGRLARLVAEGRARCHASVEELIEAKLAPLLPQLSLQIWSQVKPLLAERRGAPPPS